MQRRQIVSVSISLPVVKCCPTCSFSPVGHHPPPVQYAHATTISPSTACSLPPPPPPPPSPPHSPLPHIRPRQRHAQPAPPAASARHGPHQVRLTISTCRGTNRRGGHHPAQTVPCAQELRCKNPQRQRQRQEVWQQTRVPGDRRAKVRHVDAGGAHDVPPTGQARPQARRPTKFVPARMTFHPTPSGQARQYERAHVL